MNLKTTGRHPWESLIHALLLPVDDVQNEYPSIRNSASIKHDLQDHYLKNFGLHTISKKKKE